MNERKPKEEKKINENFQNELDTLTSISSIVFGLNKENTRESAKLIYQNHYDDSISFNTIIVQMIYNVFVIKMKDDDEIYSDFIKEMTILELHKKSKSKIFNVFSHYLLHKCTGESFYILNKMVENKFFDVKIVQKQNSSYFAHYISEKEAKNFRYTKEIEENYEELSKNDWELHKKLIKEGHNPNEIAKIIRNDEIEKLQEISTQINFDFNQKIKPSLYERCSFVNDYNVTLIDYAAFFSSVKCFKYLIMNGANAFNTGKYAIAGGNEEIIHLCEQNHSTFKDAYETAIEFHHNNIFKYLYENKIAKINDLEELGKKCVLHHNYELFSFLTKEGMKINNDIINESAKIGNIFLTKYFLEFNTIPKDILIFSSESGNIELVKYILEQGIDVNTKNISLSFMKFILIF